MHYYTWFQKVYNFNLALILVEIPCNFIWKCRDLNINVHITINIFLEFFFN